MNTFHELSQDMLVRLTQIDYHNEMALIAVVDTPDGYEQIGVARYATNVDRKSCEFALVVSDAWHGRGLGHHLMRDLMNVAKDRDLDIIEGQVLAKNSRMLKLMESLGYEVVNDADDGTIKRVIKRLHKAA